MKGNKNMLKKENKQQAEQVRQQLAPLFAKASKLANIWIKAKQEESQADRVAQFWQYVGTGSEWAHRETIPQDEQERARTTKQNNKREWVQELDRLYLVKHEKETHERACFFNFKNYLYFICEMIAETLRPIAWEIYNTRGDTFKEWADIITPKEPKEWTPRTLYTSIYIDAVFSDGFCLKVHIWGAGACGVDAVIYRYYDKNPEKHHPEQPKEPKKMTAKQYAERLQKLKDYETKAQEVRREQWAKAKEWGMLDSCELLKYPQTEKAR